MGIKIIFINIIIIIRIAAPAVKTPGTKKTVKNKKAALRTARRTAPIKTLKIIRTGIIIIENLIIKIIIALKNKNEFILSGTVYAFNFFLFIYAFNFFSFAAKFVKKLIRFFINFSKGFINKIKALLIF